MYGIEVENRKIIGKAAHLQGEREYCYEKENQKHNVHYSFNHSCCGDQSIYAIWSIMGKRRIWGNEKRKSGEKFLETFPESRNFIKISTVENDTTIVYLGITGTCGNYAIFQKSAILNRWFVAETSTIIRAELCDSPTWGRVYLAMNKQNIVKAVVEKDGNLSEIEIDPAQPLIVITDYDIDSITFFTESGEALSEKEFLNTVY